MFEKECELILKHYKNQLVFPDYRSFADYFRGRRSRLKPKLADKLTMDHGSIWKSYYSKVKGFAGKHELFLVMPEYSPDGQLTDITFLMLRLTSPTGETKTSLIYGRRSMFKALPRLKIFYKQNYGGPSLDDTETEDEK